jgi:hypothetical protein
MALRYTETSITDNLPYKRADPTQIIDDPQVRMRPGANAFPDSTRLVYDGPDSDAVAVPEHIVLHLELRLFRHLRRILYPVPRPTLVSLDCRCPLPHLSGLRGLPDRVDPRPSGWLSTWSPCRHLEQSSGVSVALYHRTET